MAKTARDAKKPNPATANIVGYASIGLIVLIASRLQLGWLVWASTLILNGPMFWLARVEPSWPLSAWLPGAFTYVVFGVVLGLIQWIALRGRVRRADWWVALSTIGWGLLGAAGLAASLVAGLASFVLFAVTGAALLWLTRENVPA